MKPSARYPSSLSATGLVLRAASNRPSRPPGRLGLGGMGPGGLGSYTYPFAIAVRENIHPDHLDARVFAVRGACLHVTALNNGGLAQYLHVHWSQFDGVGLVLAALDVRDELLLRELPAVIVYTSPIVGDDPADPFAITRLVGISPIPFELFQCLRGALALRSYSRIGECQCPDAHGEHCSDESLHGFSPVISSPLTG